MGLLGRWRRDRGEVAEQMLDADDVVVLVRAFEASRADSAVLAEAEAAGTDLSRPLLLRHHLVLPTREAVTAAVAVLDDDGYRVLAAPVGEESGPWRVRASRQQLLTVLGVAQERSRMAGLAQRLRGDALGWDAARSADAG